VKNRIMGLFALLIIALSIVGFAYAHWTDTIYIKGSVETGTVAVAWTAKGCYDNEGTGERPQDIGKFTCEFSEYKKDVHTGKDGYGLLTVTITNAYPSYMVTCNVNLTVIGTLPVHVKAVTVKESDPGKLTFSFSGVVPSDKLEPCHDYPCVFTAHVTQDASQCTTYTFSVIVDVEQAQ